MNPQCAKCKRSHSTRDETLLTCFYCSMSWHHVCHVPCVSNIELMDLIYLNRREEKIDFTRCGWSCGNCKALVKTSNPKQSISALKAPTNTREDNIISESGSSGSSRSRWTKQTARKSTTRDQWRVGLDESSNYDDIETIDPLLGRAKQTARKSATSDPWYTDDEFSDSDTYGIDALDSASDLTEQTARKGKAVIPWSANILHGVGISDRGGIESSSKQPSSSTSSRSKQTARKSSTSDPWYTNDDDDFISIAEIEALAHSSRYDYPGSPAASSFDSYDALFALTKAFELQSLSPNPTDHVSGRKKQTARKASTVRSPHSWRPTSVSAQRHLLPMDTSVRDRPERTIQKGPVQNRNTWNTNVSSDRAKAQVFNRHGSIPLYHGPSAQMYLPQPNPPSNNSSREFGRFFSDMSGHAQAPSRKKQTARKATNNDSGLAKNYGPIAPIHTIGSPYIMPVQTTGNVGTRNPWSSNNYNAINPQTIGSPSTRPIQATRKSTTSDSRPKSGSAASQPRTLAPFTVARTGWAMTQASSITEARAHRIRNVANSAHDADDNHDGSIAWWVNARERATSSTNNPGSHASGQRKKGGRKKGHTRHIGGQEMESSGFTFVSRNWSSKQTLV